MNKYQISLFHKANQLNFLYDIEAEDEDKASVRILEIFGTKADILDIKPVPQIVAEEKNAVICYSPAFIELQGYKSTGISSKDAHTYYFLRYAAMTLDVMTESLRAFRIEPDMWMVFYDKEVKRPFKDAPILP